MASTTVSRNGTMSVHMTPPHGDTELLSGWRKKMLYVLVATTIIITSLNASLLMWTIKVLDLSSDGPGVLTLTTSGMKISGHGQFLDILTLKRIQHTAQEKGLIIESAGDVKLQSLNRQGRYHNSLTLGSGILESRGSHFLVRNPQDNVLFRSDPSEVVVATDNLRISTKAGFQLDGSLHAEVVRGGSARDLKVESPTKRISVHGEEQVSMVARAGDTLVTSLQDIHLHTRKGQIVVDCSRLEIKDLEVADPTVRSTDVRVYQLCSCDDGVLFLTPSERHCRASTDLCSSFPAPSIIA
ncbi:zeta-sarcoglycan-like [Dermacentor andersoni]|uniref:zeta-sarcoglycan-like n=1 Tax=Dermacentor andersoni TaxID=34620 RepID=UPI002155CCFD|nr:zeta-sarcoglycan-like [Dermacentor andersoni]XP_054933062.1 zeta-sarcoglycan-like [Dermacentor andersoni]